MQELTILARRYRGVLAVALLSLLIPTGGSVWAQSGPDASDGITILAYNVENLFDAVADGTEYPQFNPSRGKWDDHLYHLRLENTARVVRAAVAGGPDIVVFEEIENRNVLRTLADKYLTGLGYRTMAMVPVPRSAVNVGVLSRYSVTDIRAHEVHTGAGHPLRNILELWIDCGGTPLVLFACHWKSKSGGAEQTEDGRLLASRIIVTRMREIFAADASADVVVAGDLNENVDEYQRVGGTYQTAIIPLDGNGAPASPFPERFIQNSIFAVDSPNELSRYASADASAAAPLVMFTPWAAASAPAGEGSYWYHGDWETIDQFLLSPGLFDARGLSFDSFRVVAPGFILNRLGHPSSWETSRAKGYSDHLPILLTLRRRKAEAAGRD